MTLAFVFPGQGSQSIGMLNALAADGRAVRVPFADGPRWVAGEEHELYAGRATDATLQRLFQRYIQHHGPVTSSELARRFGTTRERVDQLAHHITRESAILQGRFRPPGMPGADEPQWCYRPNVERIHRQTLSILRKEIRPSPMAQFTRFLLRWQHLTPTERLSGGEATRTVLEQLEGLSLPIDIWTRDVFPTRIARFEASSLDSPGSAHATVWVGAGHGKVMPVLRGSGGVFLNAEPPPDAGLRPGLYARGLQPDVEGIKTLHLKTCAAHADIGISVIIDLIPVGLLILDQLEIHRGLRFCSLLLVDGLYFHLSTALMFYFAQAKAAEAKFGRKCCLIKLLTHPNNSRLQRHRSA